MPLTDPERVIVEILRNASTDGINKTKLYKSFYLAHLVYAKEFPGLLTTWPIARTPQGPGISDSYQLLDKLTQTGYLTREDHMNGPYPEQVFRWTNKDLPGEPLPADVVLLIRRVTDFVLPKSVSQISDMTHEHSRSWIEGVNGQMLEIYTDLIDDEEYDRREAELASMEANLNAALSPIPDGEKALFQ